MLTLHWYIVYVSSFECVLQFCCFWMVVLLLCSSFPCFRCDRLRKFGEILHSLLYHPWFCVVSGVCCAIQHTEQFCCLGIIGMLYCYCYCYCYCYIVQYKILSNLVVLGWLRCYIVLRSQGRETGSKIGRVLHQPTTRLTIDQTSWSQKINGFISHPNTIVSFGSHRKCCSLGPN